MGAASIPSLPKCFNAFGALRGEMHDKFGIAAAITTTVYNVWFR